jgi:hypothetical protein
MLAPHRHEARNETFSLSSFLPFLWESCKKCPEDQCPPVKGCEREGSDDGKGMCQAKCHSTLRTAFLGIQIFFIALSALLIVFVVCFRKERVRST